MDILEIPLYGVDRSQEFEQKTNGMRDKCVEKVYKDGRAFE